MNNKCKHEWKINKTRKNGKEYQFICEQCQKLGQEVKRNVNGNEKYVIRAERK